jgi:hypothetical protein
MHNVELVDVLNSSYNLLEDGTGLVFSNPELNLMYLRKT